MLPSSEPFARRGLVHALVATSLALASLSAPAPPVFAATASSPARDTTRATSTVRPARTDSTRGVRTDEVVVDENGIRIGSRAASGGSSAPATPATPGTPAAPEPPSPPDNPDIDIDVSRHGGDVVRFGEHVTIRKGESIAGDVVVIGGSIDVYGRVSGDVVAVGGEIDVRDGAVVNGEAVCVGGPVHQEDGSEVRGEVVSVNLGGPFGSRHWARSHGHHVPSAVGFMGRLISTIIGLGLLVGLACLVVLVFGTQVDRISAAVTRDPWKSAAIGLLTVIALPPIMFLVAVTVIGIPAAIVLAIAWFLANVFGMVAVSRVTGNRFAHLTVNRSPYFATGIGFLILSSLFVLGGLLSRAEFIPIPGWPFTASGFLVLCCASVMGLGAVVTTRFGRREWFPGRGGGFGGPGPVPPPAPVAPVTTSSVAAPPPSTTPSTSATSVSSESSAAPAIPATPAADAPPATENDIRRRWDPEFRGPTTPDEGTRP